MLSPLTMTKKPPGNASATLLGSSWVSPLISMASEGSPAAILPATGAEAVMPEGAAMLLQRPVDFA